MIECSTPQADSAKQQLQLSDSYLPVAMQVIAHLTDQMAFEAKDEPQKPQADPTTKPTIKPPAWTRPPSPPTKPPTSPPYLWTKPPNSVTKPPNVWVQPVKTTTKPYVADEPVRPLNGGWWMSYGLLSRLWFLNFMAMLLTLLWLTSLFCSCFS